MMKDVKGSCTNFTQPVCLQKECISLAFGVSVGGFGILARSWLESASPELVSTPQNAVRISNAAILEISPQWLHHPPCLRLEIDFFGSSTYHFV